MLAIRMQRTGRKGHAMFRMVVQDSRRTPSSGKIVASLGNYDPHAKTASLDKEKAQFYLEHGAQPSERAAHLLKGEGLKLPAWVTVSETQKRETRNPDKRRSTRPAEPVAETPAEPEIAADTAAAEAAVAEAEPQTTAEETKAVEAEEKTETESAAEPAAETPATETETPADDADKA